MNPSIKELKYIKVIFQVIFTLGMTLDSFILPCELSKKFL
jgi:hypothetical protein